MYHRRIDYPETAHISKARGGVDADGNEAAEAAANGDPAGDAAPSASSSP